MLDPADYAARVQVLIAKPLFQEPHRDLAIPPGWLPIIEGIVSRIEHLPDVHVRQIKEKFGGLRVNTTGFVDLVNMQEPSLKTCFVCGEPGERRKTGGLLFTVCDQHDVGQAAIAELFIPYRAALAATGGSAWVW